MSSWGSWDIQDIGFCSDRLMHAQELLRYRITSRVEQHLHNAWGPVYMIMSMGIDRSVEFPGPDSRRLSWVCSG